MPWLARSHFEASSPPQRSPASHPTPAHCHRRHHSSVADDYEVARRTSQRAPQRVPQTTALSPLSPRWSVASVVEEEDEDDEDGIDLDIDDDEDNDPSAIQNSPSYRNSVLSMASTNTTSTTSTLRRYWSPSPSSPSSSPRPTSRSRPLSESSSPPYRSQLSRSPTLSPVTSAAPSSSPSTAPSTASSTAPSTAPSTSYISESSSISNLPTLYRPSTPFTSDHVVTFIPPLVDGASGTLSRWQRVNQYRRRQQQQQQPTAPDTFKIRRITPNSPSSDSPTTVLTPYRLLWSDLRWLAANTPDLLRLAWAKASTPIWAVARPRVWSRLLTVPVDDITDAAEALLQSGLAISEVAMLAAAPTLFLCLPGGLFLVWLFVCFGAVYAAAWPLNGAQARTGTIYRSWATNDGGDRHSSSSDDDSQDDDDTQDDDDDQDRLRTRTRDEHWFFVPGLGATSRSLAKTGPRVAAVFGRPITLLRPAYTYGAVADALLFVLLPRLLLPFCVLPVRGVDSSVYAEIRRALLSTANHPRRRSSSRIVVLAHNTGATVVAQALARLAGDVPASRLAQLEVYTFGSLAPDFVVPTRTATAGDQQTEAAASPTFHVEHVAHANDPCARFGVLRSVREDLAGRYGGGVFVVGGGKGGGGGNVNSSSMTTSSEGIGLGLGLSVSSTTTGFRPVSRGRSFSPPLPNINSINNSKNRNSRHRMSFPFTYQQQQQYQHFVQNPVYRRSVSASTASSMASDVSLSVASLLPPRKTMLSMEDYLTALFGPEPWSMRPDPEVDLDGNRLLSLSLSSSSSSNAYFLDAAIAVDRELAEKREMAAMAIAANVTDGPSSSRRREQRNDDRPSLAKTAHHRLSWTGLGATAKYGTTKGTILGSTKTRRKSNLKLLESPAVADGLRGLETVRRLCKECDGRPGREVSVLAGYFADAVTRHREQFGF